MKIVGTLLGNMKTYGVGPYLFYLVLTLINKIVPFKVLIGMNLTPELLAKGFTDQNPDYEYRFLTPEELRQFAKDPANDLPQVFLEKVLLKGDRCYGILHAGKMVNCGWYSNKPAEVFPGLNLHFDPEYIYMFRGFTLPEYRGQRLHAVSMAKAMLELCSDGRSKGLISYVEAVNLASLRSVYRMGYRNFGKVLVVQLGGAYLVWGSPGCKRFAFGLKPAKTSNLRFLSLSKKVAGDFA